MHCEKCGKQIKDSSKFCQFCGAKTSEISLHNNNNMNQTNNSGGNKLILPVAILLSALILGGFYYAIQINRQKSIEKQELLKIESERKKEQEDKTAREDCYNEAVDNARSLLKTKAELEGGARFKEGAEQDLYLKDDFNDAYENCLSKKGLKK